MKNFAEHEKAKNAALIKHSNLFNGAEGGGKCNGRPYAHILQDPKCNLYIGIQEEANAYFNKKKFWHRCHAHATSSQASCINHLWPIAKKEEAVKAIINKLGYDFQKVLPLTDDMFINFEVKGPISHINETEGRPTQIDAVIIAQKEDQNQNVKNTLIVFEWKYTESYGNTDKSTEESGGTRIGNYNGLINKSKYLKGIPNGYETSNIYYLEPFYQLMRQTLWASQFKGKKLFGYEISDYLHIHVVPYENEALLYKKYPINKERRIDTTTKDGSFLKDTWLNTLRPNGRKKYKLVSPEELFMPLAENLKTYDIEPDLIDYLRLRYW